MRSANLIQSVIIQDGYVAANSLAKVLHITQHDLAEAIGVELRLKLTHPLH